ncbi:TlpA family protein disulfide reductase [Thiomicrolovo sp. ZZH C-3]
MRKAILASAAAIALLFPVAQAADKEQNVERGRYFGEFDANDANKTTKGKKSPEQLLAEILETEKKQLEVQKKMLAILQDTFDPQPKKIVVNGKECIENESAECYRTPLTPFAKSIPAIAAWVSNPTIDTAANYMSWYVKHTDHAEEGSYVLQLAKAQYGDKAAPMNLNRPEFMHPFGGQTSAMREKTVSRLVNEVLKDEYELFVFMGLDFQGDAFAMPALAKIAQNMDGAKITLVHYSTDTQSKLQAFSKKFKEMRTILDHTDGQIVGEHYFTEFGVYATPSVLIRLKNGDTQMLAVGKVGQSALENDILRYLKLKKVIKPNYLVDYKSWQDSTHVQDNFWNTYNYVPNVNLYNYHTDKEPLDPPAIDAVEEMKPKEGGAE